MPPEVQEHLTLLRGRVHRMEGLIDGILEFSRAGRTREDAQRVEVGALLAEVVDLLSPPQDVEIRLPGDAPVIQSERLPLQQVLMNLLGNAIKYGRPETGEGASRFAFRMPVPSGSSRSPTTGRASIPSTMTASSASFSAWTRATRWKEPASGFRW